MRGAGDDGEERERSDAKAAAMDVDAGVADEDGGRTRRRAAVFNIIRVRGAAKSRPVARDAFSSRDDDEREGSTEVSNDVTSRKITIVNKVSELNS